MKNFLEKIKKNKEIIFIIGLLVIASFLRFYHLDRADITNDASMYSFRSIGYLDYTVSNIQTTPLNWFGHFHWWSKLSFHDAPPLVFIIQYFFFKIFGINLFAARLPFVIFGILTVLVFYFLVKNLYDKKIAVLASVFLAVDAYHTLSSQSGLLEPILLFFMILSLLYFYKGFKDSKYFIYSAIFFGLSMLSKYLALSIVPAFILLIILNKNRWQILKDKKLYLAILIFLIIISPLVIYNFKMLRSRGHFDMQLAFLLSQKQEDWTSISSRQAGANLRADFFGFFEAIKNSSVIIYWLFLISLVYFLIKLIFYKERKHLFLGLVLFSLLIFFTLIGSSARYLAILPPFVCLVIAIFLFDSIKEFPKLKYCVFGLIGILLIYLIIFNLNSNQVFPWGKNNFAYSSYREDNWGYNNLERYWLSKYPGVEKTEPAKIKKINDVFLADNLDKIPEILKGNLLVFDDRMNWFAKEWYIYRWLIYYRAPFLSSDEFVTLAKESWGVNLLNSLGARNLLFIKATKNTFLDPGEANLSTTADLIEEKLSEQQIKPIDIIYNPKGEEAFKIYKIPHLIRKN